MNKEKALVLVVGILMTLVLIAIGLLFLLLKWDIMIGVFALEFAAITIIATIIAFIKTKNR